MSPAGKPLNSPAVNYFILNYDTDRRFVALERVPYVDGFFGKGSLVVEMHCFKKQGFGCSGFKVHGSIELCLLEDEFSASDSTPV